MPTSPEEGTADREYHDPRGRDLTFQDEVPPTVGAFLIGACLLLTFAIIIAQMVRWLG